MYLLKRKMEIILKKKFGTEKYNFGNKNDTK